MLQLQFLLKKLEVELHALYLVLDLLGRRLLLLILLGQYFLAAIIKQIALVIIGSGHQTFLELVDSVFEAFDSVLVLMLLLELMVIIVSVAAITDA